MRLVVEIFREPDGRLQGTLQNPGGKLDAFTSILDLLRILERLDLPRPPSWEVKPLDPQQKESHG